MKLPTPIQEFIYEPPVSQHLWPRHVMHIIVGSAIPIGVLLLPLDLAKWLLIVFSVLAVALEVGRASLPTVNDLLIKVLPFFKPHERFQITGATYYWLSATFVVFAFPEDIAVLSLLFLSFGDPFATVVGSRDHRARIFGKSIAGTAAFAAVAVIAGAVASLHPDVPLAWWLVPGAIAAAVAELLPSPLDDNVTVPLAAAITMALLSMIA
ncbi:MAG: hypothetical protein J4N29_05140 [Chloroflexi bacterium]|nr:hypothetical protein [Chloroflexota bacterium]MCI0778812.1 hypothetical protein [Chloroflexota bacterium]MCI0816415.1 hypothetical protein [Chloroflexota bacterium]